MKLVDFKLINNFNLLRLLFALQVFWTHILLHNYNDLPPYPILTIISNFPGVPGFFFISGFLIYASYLNCNNYKDYFLNRFLRLYPALFTVTFVSLLFILFYKGMESFTAFFLDYIVWYIGQISFYAFYTPEHLRDLGVGAVNGSLWTISVELSFYLAIPIIVEIEKKIKSFVLISSLISFLIYFYLFDFLQTIKFGNYGLGFFLKHTLLSNWWMFGIGILFYKYYNIIILLMKSKVILLLFLSIISFSIIYQNYAYDSYIIDSLFQSDFRFSEGIGIIYYIAFATLIFYSAFCIKTVTIKNDLSYSIYLWHMPIINVFIIYNYNSILVSVLLVGVISFFSWIFIEKKALEFKRKTILN